MTDLQKAYKLMQANCGIEVGDKVTCLRHFGLNEAGWQHNDSSHAGCKKRFVNDKAIGTVIAVTQSSISVDCGHDYSGSWLFPFYTLKVTEKAPPPPKEMTVSQVCKELGYEIKIVK